MNRQVIALILIIAWLAPLFPVPGRSALARAEETVQVAKGGPILWYIDDPEKRKAMEEDLELLRLYNEAQDSYKTRRAIGWSLFIPGVIGVAGGFAAGLFSTAIGLYDEEQGDTYMVVGVSVGLTLVAGSLCFAGIKWPAENRYEKYVHEKYGVVPIMHITPTTDGWFAAVGVRF